MNLTIFTITAITLPEDLYAKTTICLYTYSGENMPKITLSIPKELKEKLNEHPELNWSEILRRGIQDKIQKLKRFKEMEKDL